MATQTMNQFRITRQNGATANAVCATMKDAVNMFDTPDNPATQAVRVAIGLQVIIPDTPVQVTFRTIIGGAGAETAGCIATPTGFTVDDGTNVIFEAIPAAGYDFVGWWVDRDPSVGVPDSIAPIASLAINASISTAADVVITAQFVPTAP